ncbi:MAG: hypothetical protein HYS22_06615 [Deltaproteobacteria bacterium]|nr:hypothetical protein [Deltaproteobacteria bacterium]
MQARLRIVQEGEFVVKTAPHLNIRCLQRKAASALHHIAASGFEDFRYPRVWVRYLRNILEKLQEENPPPLYELAEVEDDLEAIEAGMLHMNITTRPVEVLFLPRSLSPELINRLACLKQKIQPQPPVSQVPLENRYNMIPLRQRLIR